MGLILGFTAHRPNSLIGGWECYERGHLMELSEFLACFLDVYEPDVVRLGMATGGDIAMAYACYANQVKFIACVPFPGQERKWSPKVQNFYNFLLKEALAVNYTLDKQPKDKQTAVKVLMQRNKDVANGVDIMLALWNKQPKGGTYNCIRYCQSIHVPVVNLWDLYITRFNNAATSRKLENNPIPK